MNQSIRSIIDYARCHDIEINEITVSPEQYKALEVEAVSSRTYDTNLSETCLRFRDVTINKRKCKGCCEHG